MQKSTVLVSACLLGVKCRYNAVCGMADGLEELMECAQLIPVCPETLGGLPTPRPPAERVGNRVVNCEGGDVTRPYVEGAQECLKLARLFGAEYALMKDPELHAAFKTHGIRLISYRELARIRKGK